MNDVTVFSSSKLSADDTKLLKTYLANNFSTSSPVFKIDESLIAGVKIVGSGKQLELSLSDLLTNLGQSIS